MDGSYGFIMARKTVLVALFLVLLGSLASVPVWPSISRLWIFVTSSSLVFLLVRLLICT